MSEKPEHCPRCGSMKVARILYGLPLFNDELERKLQAGEVVLGGCVVTGDDPTWVCVACNHHWGKRADRI